MKSSKVSTVACLMVFGLLVSPAVLAQNTPDTTEGNSLTQLSDAFESLSERAGRAVVQISVVRYTLRQGGIVHSSELLGLEHTGGSGVIVSEDGYIVTNAHVVENARNIKVLLTLTVSEKDTYHSVLKPRGKMVNARIVGIDGETDLAVLKVDEERLPFLEFGDSDELRQGQIVLAFGSPQGLENSVTMGVVSSVARQLRADDPMIYIQTDAPINPGNSGGPLVDIDGRIVGINTLILSHSGGDEGISFAAPSNIVRHVYREIRERGRVRRSHIGINAQSITPTLAAGLGLPWDWGVVVADVYPGQPADRAGLRTGDVIIRVDGKVMENARQFDVNVYQREPGDYVNLELFRGSEKMNLRVRTIQRDDDLDRIAAMVTPEENHIERLGILAIEIDSKIAQILPPPRKRGGVLVAAMAADGPNRNGGLLPGDVIYAFNGKSISGLPALRSELESLNTGDAVVLHVQRQRKLMYLAFELESVAN
ncbi:trypsin-like peptidase domain-containing protein [Acidobacteria bacterium AH-259-O06]|nr:trypsin-like peptidase domain-containing protein [Acidobacteria bacterium AH-259-O06]